MLRNLPKFTSNLQRREKRGGGVKGGRGGGGEGEGERERERERAREEGREIE